MRRRTRSLRARMALAALKAGLAFSNTKTALAHSISYEMTLRFGLPHGIACSFTLPMVLARAIGADRSARRRARAGLRRRSAGRRRHGWRASSRPLAWRPISATYGVSEADSQRMVPQALEGVRGRNFIGDGEGS